MKLAGLALVAVMACGFFAAAEEFPEFVAGMKVVGTASAALQKMEKKTGPQAVGAAERIGSTYEEMINLWRQRNAPDAVKLSEQGKAAALELANAANAGDDTRATAALQTLNSTCKNCHAAHRETAGEHKYRIK